MVNIFSKTKLTYLGMYDNIKIYSEKTYALIYTDESAKETLRVF